jgi:putative inorganic carbon (HCO3(-)) transporter
MSRMWRYTLAVIILWVVNPELRRLYDWKFGFSALEILSVLPLLSLVPHVWSLTLGGGWRRLPRVVAFSGWVWLGGFTYALVIGIVSGNTLSGTYTFISYVFPVVIGLWIAADEAPFSTAHARVMRVLFALTTVVSVYGVVQYVVAPAWDALWLQNQIDQGSFSFGKPLPFQIRVFSTLNSSGIFGMYMAIVLLIVLPQLSLRRPLLLAQIPIWLIAFGLSLVRAGWLMFAIGAGVYLLFTPRRRILLATFAFTAVLFAGLVVALPAAVGNDSLLTSLTNRLNTLSDLDNDTSGRQRANLYGEAGELISVAPFGRGLGVLGTSTKLSNAETTTDFDSGILARAVEMGIPGVTLYILPLLLLVGATFRVWNDGRKHNDRLAQSFAAMAVGLEVAFAGQQLAGEANGVMFLLLWLVMCLAVRARPDAAVRDATGHGAMTLAFS